MIEKTTQSVANLGYHAHIYYDPTKTRAVAERVCAAIEQKFRVENDGFRDEPRGPHPISNVLIVFKPDQFEQIVPYLMLNRAGLDVSGASADHGRGGRPQRLCDVARQPGRAEASHAAPRPRRAAAERGKRVGTGASLSVLVQVRAGAARSGLGGMPGHGTATDPSRRGSSAIQKGASIVPCQRLDRRVILGSDEVWNWAPTCPGWPGHLREADMSMPRLVGGRAKPGQDGSNETLPVK